MIKRFYHPGYHLNQKIVLPMPPSNVRCTYYKMYGVIISKKINWIIKLMAIKQMILLNFQKE